MAVLSLTAAIMLVASLFGTAGNLVALLSFWRDSQLREVLGGSLRALMSAHASVDLLVCSIGLPLNAFVLVFGTGAPYTWPLVCHATIVLFWNFSYVSVYFMWTLALTRLLAVFAPQFFRNATQNKSVTIALVVLPFCVGLSVWTWGSLLTDLVYIEWRNSTPYCLLLATSDESALYFKVDSLVNSAFPLPCGLAFYLLLLAKIAAQPKLGVSSSTVNTVSVAPAGSASGAGGNAPKKTTSTRTQRVRMLALVFLINVVLMLPNMMLWATGLKDPLYKTAPLLVDIVSTSYFVAMAVNPYAYVIVSKDLRAAFMRTVGCNG